MVMSWNFVILHSCEVPEAWPGCRVVVLITGVCLDVGREWLKCMNPNLRGSDYQGRFRPLIRRCAESLDRVSKLFQTNGVARSCVLVVSVGLFWLLCARRMKCQYMLVGFR